LPTVPYAPWREAYSLDVGSQELSNAKTRRRKGKEIGVSRVKEATTNPTNNGQGKPLAPTMLGRG